jgi:hypothetical protein
LLELDVRDFAFWVKLAHEWRLKRRMETYSVSLLPHQKPDYIKSQVDGLYYQIYTLENEEDIAAVEKAAQKRLEEIRKEKRERRR